MDLRAELSPILHPSRIHTRLIDRVAYAHDASYFHLVPQAVVQPTSIGEIQALFSFTQRHRIPMTFRAAGTSLSGQAISDGILVDISKHWDKYQVEREGTLIRTQPGIVGGFLNNVLKAFGRRIGPDPASIDACMMGGILANNSSGMCCGVTENAYRTIHSMTFVLPDGFTLNSADPQAAQIFENEQPLIAHGLLELRRRILRSTTEYKGETLAAKIRRRYQMKNNNGYLLNAFLDYDSPLDILTHLLVGSEGTLGFIAEAVLHTLPDYPRRYTGQLYFKTLQDAADSIGPIQRSGARAAEIMDRPSLRSIEHLPGAPSLLASLPETAAAILVEYQAENGDALQGFKNAADRVLKELRLLHDAEFTEDPAYQASMWKLRKGIIPSVGAMRPAGTTLLCEDIVFPVPALAAGITDLQQLFTEHGYPQGVVFGHAKDGNLHFLISQSFNTDSEIARFAAFMEELVRAVSGKYDGALKAEHGTGRNTAPYVAIEWGDEAYAIMRELKSLLDPDNMLNPGVVINPDPHAHVTHVKSMASVAPEVDKCIECGFCESKCPSRWLTMTPRQRIVVRREIARMRAAQDAVPGAVPLRASFAKDAALRELLEDFTYAGVETCAADGMCATACPVGINTGDYIKHLRAETIKDERAALWVAEHFQLVEKGVGRSVSLGHLAEKVIGAEGVKSISLAAEKLTGATLPKWNEHIPSPASIARRSARKEFIYFPSCISRQLGVPGVSSRVSGSAIALSEALVEVAQRANISLCVPPDILGTCCGMPFASKGYASAYKSTLHKTLLKLWEWSEAGKYPVVMDTTSCTHSLSTCGEELRQDDQELWKQMTILDVVEFLHDFVLPRLEIQPLDEEVVLHPNCSARRLGLESKMFAIANQCARSAVVPLNLGCCGFAGDRGLLFPELTASAAQRESAEVNGRAYDGYYSSNIPCEIGMSQATGKDYTSIVYLVERASRK